MGGVWRRRPRHCPRVVSCGATGQERASPLGREKHPPSKRGLFLSFCLLLITSPSRMGVPLDPVAFVSRPATILRILELVRKGIVCRPPSWPRPSRVLSRPGWRWPWRRSSPLSSLAPLPIPARSPLEARPITSTTTTRVRAPCSTPHQLPRCGVGPFPPFPMRGSAGQRPPTLPLLLASSPSWTSSPGWR